MRTDLDSTCQAALIEIDVMAEKAGSFILHERPIAVDVHKTYRLTASRTNPVRIERPPAAPTPSLHFGV